jgi:hypothetical protein
VEDQDLEELSNKDEIATNKKAKCVVPWSFMLFYDCNFLNFALCFIFNKVIFYIKFYNFLCDYKFIVLQLIKTWIQQLLCFHICRFQIFSKLDKFVVLKFPKLSSFCLQNFEKIQHLSFLINLHQILP